MSFELRSPVSQSSDVHSTDTPRTKELKELRLKRLAYYDTSSANHDKKSVSSPRPPSHPKAKSGQDSPKGYNIKKKPEGGTPGTSSPRTRRSLYRPRSASANSEERSPRSQNSSLEQVQARDSTKQHNLIDLHLDITPRTRLGSASSQERLDISITPRVRRGSASSQDLRLESLNTPPPLQNSSQRNALRDSFGSLFSDIGSDFTDVTNTDILLSERFADEPASAIRRKKDSTKSKNTSGNNRLLTGSTNQGHSTPKRTTGNPKVSKVNGYNGILGNHGNHGDSHVSSDHSDGKSVRQKSEEVEVINRLRSGSSSSVDGRNELAGEKLYIQNVSLDSGSRSTVSGHTSLWLDSDKSTGQRTLSQDNLLDDLVAAEVKVRDLYESSGTGRGGVAPFDTGNNRSPVTGVIKQGPTVDTMTDLGTPPLLNNDRNPVGNRVNQGQLEGFDKVWETPMVNNRTNMASNTVSGHDGKKSEGYYGGNWGPLTPLVNNDRNGASNTVSVVKGGESDGYGRVRCTPAPLVADLGPRPGQSEAAYKGDREPKVLPLVSNKENIGTEQSERAYKPDWDQTIPLLQEKKRDESWGTKVVPIGTGELTMTLVEGRPPLNAQSKQFMTASNGFEEPTDDKAQQQQLKDGPGSSLNAENLNLANLSAVLGEDRLRRLLMNFQESEDYSDIQSEVGGLMASGGMKGGGGGGQALDHVNIWASLEMSDTGSNQALTNGKVNASTNGNHVVANGYKQDGDNKSQLNNGERYHSQPNENQIKGDTKVRADSKASHSRGGGPVVLSSQNPLAESATDYVFPRYDNSDDDDKSTVIEELGLHTHRPEELKGGPGGPVYASHDRKWTYGESPGTGQTQEVSEGPCTVKYSYSVEQIYARANTLPQSGEISLETSPRVVSRLDVTLAPDAKKHVENSDRNSKKQGLIMSASEEEELDVKTQNRAQESLMRPQRGSVSKSYHGNQAGGRDFTDRKLAWSMDGTAANSAHGQTGMGRNGNFGDEHGQGDAGIQGEVASQGPDLQSPTRKKNPDQLNQRHGDSSTKHVNHVSAGPSHSSAGPSHSHTKPLPSSIERYFQSIEQVSHVSSVCSDTFDTFEPVPEPDIEVTPRGPMEVQGTEMHLSEPSTSPVKESKSPRGLSTGGKKSPQVTPLYPHTAPEQGAGLEEVSDDQLYNLVQSAISDIDTARSGAITKKLQELGINFEFLRESYESHKASQSQRTRSGGVETGEGGVEDTADTKDHTTQGEVSLEAANTITINCPACYTSNPTSVSSCTACGSVLANQKAPMHSSQSPRVSTHTQNRNASNRQSKDSSKPSSRVSESLRSQLNLNLRSSANSVDSRVDSSIATSAAGSLPAANRVPRNKRVQRLRDRTSADAESSISLDYSEKFDNPRESIPQLLKTELSIDVRRSSDSSLTPSTRGKSKARQSMVQDIRVHDDSETNSLQNDAVGMVMVRDQEVGQGEPTVGRGIIGGEGDLEGGGAGEGDSQVGIIDSNYHEFLQRLVNDPRLRNRPQPSRSQGRPSTSGTRRSQYSGVQSKVRSSWDKDTPARRWEKSNLAWTSNNTRDSLTKPSASAVVARSAAALIRPSSAGKSRDGASPQPQRKARPQSADITGRRSLPHHDCGTQQDAHHFEPQNSQRGTGPLLSVQSAVSSKGKDKPNVRESKNTRLNNYKKYLALAQGYTGKLYEEDEGVTGAQAYTDAMMMSPRVHSGEVSFMQCLPDEIMLHILSHLKHRDLARCLSVCQHFNRIASDDSLWRTISIRKCQTMTDQSLVEIGKRRPQSLSLIQCHGNKVTAQGLRELFRHCTDSLQELNFTGCSRGHLTGDHILLHAAARCSNITKLDASWCNVNDNGVIAIAEASDRLESLCVNGCQQLSDEALHSVVVKHGIYLHTLELFGCFNLTSRGLASIANHCKSLTTLNLGQCWKLTDTCVSNLAPTLSAVENLDLRGCKQIKDQTVHQVVKHCPRLRTLSLANCPNVSDASLAEIATYCNEIQSLDLCGCKQVTNQGLRSLAHSCHVISVLDLSSTAITSKSVTTLASYSSIHLEVLKLNFCKQISTHCLVKLAKNCKKLQKLFLYGVRGLGPLDEVKKENQGLLIETDQNKPV